MTQSVSPTDHLGLNKQLFSAIYKLRKMAEGQKQFGEIIYLPIGGLNTGNEPLVLPVVQYKDGIYIPITTWNLYAGTKDNLLIRLKQYDVTIVEEFEDMLSAEQRDYIFSRSLSRKQNFLHADNMLSMIRGTTFKRFRKLFILTDKQWETLRVELEKLVYPVHLFKDEKEEIQVIEVVLDEEEEELSPPKKRKIENVEDYSRAAVRKEFWEVQEATRIAKKGLEDFTREMKRAKTQTDIMRFEMACREDLVQDLIFKQHTLAEKYYKVKN